MVIVTSGEHYGAVLNPDFDYMKYLNTLQKDGMNYTRIFSGTYFEKAGSFGIERNTLAPAPGKALLPWKRSNEPGSVCGGNKFDLDQWDEAYFSRLRSFVSEASKRGIIVEVSFFSSIYGYWDIQVWNRDNNINIKDDIRKDDVQTLNNGPAMKYQENIVRKIVSELNEFDNVIYEIQNEPWADHTVTADQKSEYYNRMDFREEGAEWRNKVELADNASIEWQNRIASYITDEEKRLKNKHLIAQNYCNFYYSLTDVDPVVSILNFHYNYPVVVEQNYAHNRVIGFDESGFAGSMDVTYRKQAWSFLIAGGGLFNNLDYSFAVGSEDGTAVNRAPGGGSTDLRKQLKILSDFLHYFDFIKMKPDYEVVVQAPGAIARALSEKGRQYAIYLKNGTGCDLKVNLPKGIYSAEWISTLNGNVAKSEKIKSRGGPLILTSPSYSEDIALKIVRL
jgi:ribosomal protein S17E